MSYRNRVVSLKLKKIYIYICNKTIRYVVSRTRYETNRLRIVKNGARPRGVHNIPIYTHTYTYVHVYIHARTLTNARRALLKTFGSLTSHWVRYVFPVENPRRGSRNWPIAEVFPGSALFRRRYLRTISHNWVRGARDVRIGRARRCRSPFSTGGGPNAVIKTRINFYVLLQLLKTRNYKTPPPPIPFLIGSLKITTLLQ